MASSHRQLDKLKRWRQTRKRPQIPGQFPTGWILLTWLLYAAVGTVLAAFPVPNWVWVLAVGGIIAQTLALPGPASLRRHGWWPAQGLSLVAIGGTGAIAIALGIALGFVGTDNIDDITVGEPVFDTLRMGGLAFVLAALGAIVSAQTGDRLLARLKRAQTCLILTTICLVGLGLGAVIGRLVTS
jgi:hypothetical protein